MKQLLLFVGVLVLSLNVALAQDARTPADICSVADVVQPETRQFSQAEQVLEAGIDYRAIFCTEVGAVYVDLYERYAPVTVNNFVFLAQSGYYTDTTFHRVIADFMAQAGDPTGTGGGNPGYQFQDEFVGFLNFSREGLLAMANAGAGTNGSQFFITTAPTTWLDFKHTIFGEVLEGYDVVKSIPLRDPATATEPGAKLSHVVIVTVPEGVATTFEETATVATAETFENAFATLLTPENLPEVLKSGEGSGTFTTEEVASTAPTDLQSAYVDYLAKYNHAYRVAQEVTLNECAEGFEFETLGYRVDAFASAEEATNAFNDPLLAELTLTQGFTPVEDLANAYGAPATSCNPNNTIETRLLHLQRGRYIVTVYGSFLAEVVEQVPTSVMLLDFLAPIFEQQLVEAYASELR